MEEMINIRDDNYYVAVAAREIIVWGHRSHEQPCRVGRYEVESSVHGLVRSGILQNVWLRGDCMARLVRNRGTGPVFVVPFPLLRVNSFEIECTVCSRHVGGRPRRMPRYEPNRRYLGLALGRRRPPSA